MSPKIKRKNNYLIGIISDTHGRLPQSVARIFKNTEVAPTRAVRGNMDIGPWTRRLRENESIKINHIRIKVIHDVYQLDINSKVNAYHVVIYGHTHRPQVENQQGVLFVNPGSAVQPRHGYPPSVALLAIKGDTIKARLIDLTG